MAKIAKKALVNCTSCGGDGLYKRHTSYTREGLPYCFRCNGTGKVLVPVTQAFAVGPYVKLARVKTVDTGRWKLVPWNDRKVQWYDSLANFEYPY